MKSTLFQTIKAAVVCVLSVVLVQASTLREAAAQYSPQTKGPQSNDKSKQSAMSEGEQKAMLKIQTAPDVPAKILAAGEFVKKYPKSTSRSNIVTYIAGEIQKLPDATERITQLESLVTVFKEPGDLDVIDRILVEAYLKANRLAEAFSRAETFLSKRPDDIVTLTLMTQAGVEQAKRKNTAFAQQSKQYCERAIQVIETGKKPDNLDEVAWGQYETKWLPQLYQWAGILAMTAGNQDEAKSRLQKAVSLDPYDPVHYFFLGSVIHEEYQNIREEYQKLTAGPLRDTKRQLAEMKIDEVIDAWAHTVALSEGNSQYQQLHDAVLQDIQAYYKYRHNDSTTGLQQLIDKYKKP